MEYLIMKRMKWSWRELLETPSTVIMDIWRYMQTEAKHQEVESQKLKRKQRRAK